MHSRPLLLQADFVGQRHVVGEEQDVAARVELGARFLCSVAARDGDDDEVRIGRGAQCGGQRLRANRGHLGARGAARKDLLRLRERGLSGSLVRRLDNDDEVIRLRRRDLRGQQPGPREYLMVGLRAHHHRGILDAGQVQQRRRHLHEGDGVVIFSLDAR